MCVIVDANVAGELQTPGHTAGNRLYKWLVSGGGPMVVGGTKLRKELFGPNPRGEHRFAELLRASRITLVRDGEVDRLANELRELEVCRSDDEHIIALAQVSRARLLYSNDGDLHRDFKNRDLLNNPRGKVYSTSRSGEFRQDIHGVLLRDQNLCHRP